MPAEYEDLGMPSGEFDRHIAYDIGAAAVTRRLAEALGAPAILGRYSRLLIDLNRGEDDPTLIMRLSDGAVVPGNRNVDAGERARRIALYHAPYHAAVAALVRARLAAGIVPILVAIHSFTPRWKGVPRPWHVGILWDADPRMARVLLDRLAAPGDLVVGDNEPYRGALPNDTMYRHGTRRGLPHALVEIRQDLIGDDAGAQRWAARLGSILGDLPGDAQLDQIHHYGSLTGPVPPVEPEGAAA